ncbi:NmrA/HSCARG family protein [Yinghuangia sp. ASG 101]|uniref:NmrA/HSCARG family protein n=1 Tax=Yinghuangia sp. ASG 101 TaxID=2896848 RepID=UPI001E2A531B|nr:NmrA/HSCARG family protein [Yinghuangia sp. ASG 101]UGQ11396.1 NmrA/HSCARG family protein [Yinghuangia sp. ASG 101]
MTTHPTVLVTGATGLQGGATARQLLAAGARVRALARDPHAPRARALAQAGAEVVRGDMDDRASLDAAMRGAHGVFSVQPTIGYPGTPPGFTIEDEIRLGVNVADAANDAGIRHLVYASVGGAERSPGIRRWESKWRIEEHIRSLGLPATILRPVRFMENHSHPTTGVREGVLSDVVKPDVPVQLIAATDIGAFAALAFTDPDRYVGRALEIAGDELTFPQIVAAIGLATATAVTYRAIPREALTGADPDARAGYDFANHRGGWQADIPELRKLHPDLMDFDTWLRTEGRAQFTSRGPV